MRCAEARLTASAIIISSMMLSLVGAQVDWTRKTSLPRTFFVDFDPPPRRRGSGRCPICRGKCRVPKRFRAESPPTDAPANTMRSFTCPPPLGPAKPRETAALLLKARWLGWQDSNLRMLGSKPSALPTWRHPNQFRRRPDLANRPAGRILGRRGRVCNVGDRSILAQREGDGDTTRQTDLGGKAFC